MKQREPRSVGDCWQWKANGQCCWSFRHDFNKRAKLTQLNFPSSPTQQSEKCIENPKSLRQKPKWKNCSTAVQGLPQRNLHQSICEEWDPPECSFYKSENGGDLGEKCSCAHRQVDGQPRGAVAMMKNTRQLGCVSQDMEPPKSTTILR